VWRVETQSALHILGDVFAHHQEHFTVFTVSVSIHPSCCQLVSWTVETHSALHVLGDVFAHHQEHFTVFTVSGSVHYCRCTLVSWMNSNSSMTPADSNLGEYYQIL
jgi:hypothetical protein